MLKTLSSNTRELNTEATGSTENTGQMISTEGREGSKGSTMSDADRRAWTIN